MKCTGNLPYVRRDGFGRNLNFGPREKLSWGPPFAEYSKL